MPSYEEDERSMTSPVLYRTNVTLLLAGIGCILLAIGIDGGGPHELEVLVGDTLTWLNQAAAEEPWSD